ncbi:MAG: hypothetical protein LKJ90_06080 [Faecalibacterium sp.]|jgi:hypothetical protein|nr:hypothetical protein [Faecalibacterium sp.]
MALRRIYGAGARKGVCSGRMLVPCGKRRWAFPAERAKVLEILLYTAGFLGRFPFDSGPEICYPDKNSVWLNCVNPVAATRCFYFARKEGNIRAVGRKVGLAQQNIKNIGGPKPPAMRVAKEA